MKWGASAGSGIGAVIFLLLTVFTLWDIPRFSEWGPLDRFFWLVAFSIFILCGGFLGYVREEDERISSFRGWPEADKALMKVYLNEEVEPEENPKSE